MKVLCDHALRIEKRSVQRNRVPHDLDKAITVLIKTGQDLLFQFSIEFCCVTGIHSGLRFQTGLHPIADRPAGHTFEVALNPPAIQHTQAGTPFIAAFIPLVPDASIGGNGVLSHTSTPAQSILATSMS